MATVGLNTTSNLLMTTNIGQLFHMFVYVKTQPDFGWIIFESWPTLAHLLDVLGCKFWYLFLSQVFCMFDICLFFIVQFGFICVQHADCLHIFFINITSMNNVKYLSS